MRVLDLGMDTTVEAFLDRRSMFGVWSYVLDTVPLENLFELDASTKINILAWPKQLEKLRIEITTGTQGTNYNFDDE